MKIGRNDPCHCGSGKKYKHCHLLKDSQIAPEEMVWRRLRRVIDDGELMRQTSEFLVEHYGLDALDEAWAEFLTWRNIVEEEAPDDTLEESAELPKLTPTETAPGVEVDLDFETVEYSDFDPESPFAEVFFNWAFTFWVPDPAHTIIENEALHNLAPIELFLRLRGQHLDPLLHQYVTSLLSSAVSFYQVIDKLAGQCFTARDLMLQTDHVLFDRALRESTKPGDVLFGFIGSADGVSIFHSVWPYPLVSRDAIAIIDFRERIAETNAVTSDLLRSFDIELREMYFDSMDGNMRPPRMYTTDGETIALQELDYAIDSVDAAFEALHHLDVEASRDEQWQKASKTDDGCIEKITILWTRIGNAQHPSAISTVLGSIHLSPKRMRIEVASNERRELMQTIVEERLGSNARLIALNTPQPSRGALPMLNDADTDRLIADFLNKHYESWPDHPLPALNGQTPRKALATPSGREKVAALLLEFENAAKSPPGHVEAIRRLRERLDLFD